jgi:hypothetical protein
MEKYEETMRNRRLQDGSGSGISSSEGFNMV